MLLEMSTSILLKNILEVAKNQNNSVWEKDMIFKMCIIVVPVCAFLIILWKKLGSSNQIKKDYEHIEELTYVLELKNYGFKRYVTDLYEEYNIENISNFVEEQQKELIKIFGNDNKNSNNCAFKQEELEKKNNIKKNIIIIIESMLSRLSFDLPSVVITAFSFFLSIVSCSFIIFSTLLTKFESFSFILWIVGSITIIVVLMICIWYDFYRKVSKRYTHGKDIAIPEYNHILKDYLTILRENINYIQENSVVVEEPKVGGKSVSEEYKPQIGEERSAADKEEKMNLLLKINLK